MVAVAPAIENLTLSITQDIHVRSSLTRTFAALLEQMGPANERHDGSAMPMTLEPWPGGRWFRDLATATGTSGVTCRPSSGRRCSKSQGRCSCRARLSRTCSTASRRLKAAR
jgi:hypothetical protein